MMLQKLYFGEWNYRAVDVLIILSLFTQFYTILLSLPGMKETNKLNCGN